MRTQTIFIAYTDAERELAHARGDAKARGVLYYPIRDKKRIRQAERFQREMFRRMDEYDHWREIENRLPKLSDLRGILKGQLKPEYEGMASEDIVRDIRNKMWGGG